MLLPILHLLGTLVTLFLIMIASSAISVWSGSKIYDRVLAKASIQLDLPHRELKAGSHDKELARYLSDRYDDDKFNNRLSDLFQTLITLLEIIGFLAQISVVVIAAWFAFTEDPAYAASAWAAILVSLFFLVVVFLIMVICKLLTARAAGEAKRGRELVQSLNR